MRKQNLTNYKIEKKMTVYIHEKLVKFMLTNSDFQLLCFTV